MSFIEIENLTKTYRLGEHTITPLEEANLEIERGEHIALLGPSGSGKSTLLHLIAGLDQADSGRVVVDGAEVLSLSRREAADWRARTIGFVFQDYSLVPVLTAYENVEAPLWLFRMNRSERHLRVSTALEAVGLAEHHAHRPKQLSGGQQQRVAIARAIVADAPLIVADEPTGNLDEVSAEEVLTLLERLQRERGKTIVLVTHDSRAARRATRILRLDKGRLEAPVEDSR